MPTTLELRKHNRKAVDEIKAKIAEGIHKIIYVAGTGCGKTWVFMGIMNEIAEVIPELVRPKALYIMPKHVIRENVEGYREFAELGFDVDFATYNYFSTHEKSVNRFKKYDLIVIDECHHLGGDLYGRNILAAMEESDRLFLGLTATPFRSCDKVNVEDFFESSVYGPSVWDAIRMGLMPPFRYHICLPEKDTKEIEKEYNYKYKAVVDLNDSVDVVSDIVKTYDRDKWICFFPDIKSLNAAKQQVSEIFKGYDLFVLFASLKNLKEVVEGVKKAKKAVILSVDILLEGVHLDGITGIILYRNVMSTNAYQQMLGRTCSIGNTVEPVIVDTSQSARKILAALVRENREGSDSGEDGGNNRKKPKDILKVGIGSKLEYDINEVLKMLDPSIQRQEEMEKAARAAIEKYHSFGGKDYSSYEELSRSGIDFKKFRACAELMKLSAETAYTFAKGI